mgnify:CR=1 FL=1
MDMLREVVHPARGSRNIVELGMVDSVSVAEGRVEVALSFPGRRDPLSEYLVGSTRAAIIRNAPEGTEVEVRAMVKEGSAPYGYKPTRISKKGQKICDEMMTKIIEVLEENHI